MGRQGQVVQAKNVGSPSKSSPGQSPGLFSSLCDTARLRWSQWIVAGAREKPGLPPFSGSSFSRTKAALTLVLLAASRGGERLKNWRKRNAQENHARCRRGGG